MGKRRQSVAERNLEAQRKHELQIHMLEALKADPELKYFLGAAAGAGVAAFTSITKLAGLDGKVTGPTTGQGMDEGLAAGFGWMIGGPQVAAASYISAWLYGQATAPTNPIQMIGDILTLAAVSFAGACIAILMLKALFGGSSMAEMLKGIGEIVPG